MSESLRERVAEREKRSDTISLRNDRQLRRLLRKLQIMAVPHGFRSSF